MIGILWAEPPRYTRIRYKVPGEPMREIVFKGAVSKLHAAGELVREQEIMDQEIQDNWGAGCWRDITDG